jgi:hypothetical protein
MTVSMSRAPESFQLSCPPKRFGEGWNRGFTFQVKGSARRTRSGLSPHRSGRSIHGKAGRFRDPSDASKTIERVDFSMRVGRAA